MTSCQTFLSIHPWKIICLPGIWGPVPPINYCFSNSWLSAGVEAVHINQAGRGCVLLGSFLTDVEAELWRRGLCSSPGNKQKSSRHTCAGVGAAGHCLQVAVSFPSTAACGWMKCTMNLSHLRKWQSIPLGEELRVAVSQGGRHCRRFVNNWLLNCVHR